MVRARYVSVSGPTLAVSSICVSNVGSVSQSGWTIAVSSIHVK